MFTRRKGWKLWAGGAFFVVAVALPWLGAVWPAWSSKTIPEWAEEKGFPMTPELIAWFILGCVAIGLLFVLWFFLSPKEITGDPSPLSVSLDEILLHKHGLEFVPLRVHNNDPVKSALNFKVELTGVREANLWEYSKFPFTLRTTHAGKTQINPGGSENVDLLQVSLSQKHEGELVTPLAYVSVQTVQQQVRFLNEHTLSVGFKEPFKSGDKFSLFLRITAQDITPKNCELVCTFSKQGDNLKLSSYGII